MISKNEIVRTEIEEYKIKIYEQEKLINLLEKSGFKNVRTIKAFDINQKPDVNDESVVY